MKKLVIASLAFVALATTAFAADMPTKAPMAPQPVVYNWTGFYVGMNAGYAWGRADTTTVVPARVFAGPATAASYSSAASPNLNSNGFIGGFQLGYNLQTNNIVYGIETDFNAFSLRGSATQSFVPAAAVSLSSATEVKSDWLFTLRPRLGWAVNNWLIYATGGLAVADIKYSQVNTFATIGPEQASVSTTKAGWTAGGGVEAMIDRNWSVKAEYLYASFGSISTTAFHPLDAADAFTHSTKLNANIVRLGLNYRFSSLLGM